MKRILIKTNTRKRQLRKIISNLKVSNQNTNTREVRETLLLIIHPRKEQILIRASLLKVNRALIQTYLSMKRRR